MVEVGDHDEPVRDQKPGNAVELDDGGCTPLKRREPEDVPDRHQTEVGQENKWSLVLGEQDGVGCVAV